ncbi:putative hydroxymethylpyrimidine transport system substrate-binding protein [Frondihabitans sp. PhB188]|uniref:ABC transporter substrate-binding protein n=1 Tax=Frondihabitans sp. PhB188 TaxID=2485200 RepID=UPI000F4AF47B|nr:ABC transporter substrate-binding protein [Frondihabitans sp. PhB188]ROQ30991.1 putative hydroxymethylpyrimidine transport system substrate-binding protein [Frondihabitans sp. PhB188]
MIQEWPTADGFWIPWIVAKDKGFYKKEGIDLDIMAPPNTSATMQYLGTGRADLAFGTSVDVVTSASKGVPVVSIARYGEANNWGLMTSTGTPINPASLKGKKIGTYTDSWSAAQLQIMLANVGLKLSDVTLVTASDDTVPLLVQKKVDAITGVTNAEGSELTSLGQKYSVALAKNYGAPNAPVFSLAANSSWLSKNPALAKKFLKATIEGMNYARSHPTYAVSRFLKDYPKAETKAFATLQWKDTAPLLGTAGKTLTASDLTQTNAAWTDIVDAAAKYKVIDKAGKVSSYYTNSALQK